VLSLDSAFVPFNNSGCPFSTQLREWPIIRNSGYKKSIEDKADIWGFVSHSFYMKTQTKGIDFINFIKNNPDNDVWFMEPIHYSTNYFNPWHQGDQRHPNISYMTNIILNKLGLNVDVNNIQMKFCWCNFFAGTKEFWDIYFNIIDSIYDISKNDEYLNKMLFYTGANHGIDPNVPYFIFIVERMFPTILALTKDLKSIGFKY
jgi:hypothetical protein